VCTNDLNFDGKIVSGKYVFLLQRQINVYMALFNILYRS